MMTDTIYRILVYTKYSETATSLSTLALFAQVPVRTYSRNPAGVICCTSMYEYVYGMLEVFSVPVVPRRRCGGTYPVGRVRFHTPWVDFERSVTDYSSIEEGESVVSVPKTAGGVGAVCRRVESSRVERELFENVYESIRVKCWFARHLFV